MKTDLKDIEIAESVINKSLIYILELCNHIETSTLYEESINELIEFYNKFFISINNISPQGDDVKFLINSLPKIFLHKKIDFLPKPLLVGILELIIFPIAIYSSYNHIRKLKAIESDAAKIKKSILNILPHPTLNN